MSDVTIKNIKAIRELSFDLPGDGSGVIVMTGRNGSGKTTVVTAMSALLGTDTARLSPTRGEEAGEIEGLGRRLRVGKKQTITGAPQVKILRGVDLSVIVDPKVDDPKARTKYRIRELVSLGGKKVEPSDLLADCIDYVDVFAAKAIDDPVQCADFLKRCLESAAREKEKQADVKAELAKVRQLEAGNIDDLVADSDVRSLAELHRNSVAALSEAEQRRASYLSAIATNKSITEQIQILESEYKGTVDREAFHKEWSGINDTIAQLQEQLQKAFSQKSKLKGQLELMQLHDSGINALKGQYILPVEDPTDEELESLKVESEKAYAALLDSSNIEKRKQALEESKKLRNESADIAATGEVIRNQIVAVQAKVQELIPSGSLSIVDSDLIHAERNVPFDELSEGERWSIVLSYAIDTVGEGGVIPLSQEAWQSFAPALKQQVYDHAKAAGVVILTAQVDDGPLRAVEYEG